VRVPDRAPAAHRPRQRPRKAPPLAVRYAVYLTPPADDPLTAAAARWLGRSPFTEASTAPEAPAEARADVPARYGFHATMRAPFRLAEEASEAALVAAFERFAADWGMIRATLKVATLSNFVALVAADQSAIAEAHRAALDAFEPFRAPLNAAEIARRKPETLDERGRVLLDAHGYPHILERFRFHMTLSGALEADAIDTVRKAAAAYFAPLVAEPQPLVFALFAEPEPGGPFRVLTTLPALGRAAE